MLHSLSTWDTLLVIVEVTKTASDTVMHALWCVLCIVVKVIEKVQSEFNV